jgi:hypothetical protein
MPPERYASIIDVHAILRRGGRIPPLRRWSGHGSFPTVQQAR